MAATSESLWILPVSGLFEGALKEKTRLQNSQNEILNEKLSSQKKEEKAK